MEANRQLFSKEGSGAEQPALNGSLRFVKLSRDLVDIFMLKVSHEKDPTISNGQPLQRGHDFAAQHRKADTFLHVCPVVRDIPFVAVEGSRLAATVASKVHATVGADST